MKPIAELTDDEFVALAQQAARLPDAPAAWMARVEGAFAALAVPAAPMRLADVAGAAGALAAGTAREIRRRLIAVLTFDSAATTALASGLRGMRTETRQFLYSTEGRDVDLRITSLHGGRYALAGQILGPDEAGSVTLLPSGAGARPREVALDAMGEFHIDDLEAAEYTLTLVVGSDEIILPTFSVGSEGTGNSA
jgi:hypothetical protein